MHERAVRTIPMFLAVAEKQNRITVTHFTRLLDNGNIGKKHMKSLNLIF